MSSSSTAASLPRRAGREISQSSKDTFRARVKRSTSSAALASLVPADVEGHQPREHDIGGGGEHSDKSAHHRHRTKRRPRSSSPPRSTINLVDNSTDHG